MAYMSQENKKSKQEPISKILKKYKLKGSLSVNNYSTLVLSIKSGAIDFIDNYNKVAGKLNYYHSFTPAETYIEVNEYGYKNHFDGEAVNCIEELLDVMGIGNHDDSEPMTDYFDVGWYANIKIGSWNKPYILTK